MNGGGGIILTERLSRLLAFDPEAAWIECEAGLSLRSLLAFLLPRGFFLPVVPGTQFVTVGGAIAADVHGKNQHLDGTIGRHVLEMRLMVPSGDVLRCAPDENADVFDATVGGMGLTGTVVSARLKLLPVESAFVATSIRRAPDLSATLAAIEEDARASRYSVAWIDGLGRGGTLGRAVLIRGDHLPASELPLRHRDRPLRNDASRALTVPFDLPGFALGPTTVGAFNGLYFNAARTGTSVSTIEKFFFPLDRALHWNRLYGRRGFVQYQALLPRETAAEGCARILEEISRIRAASFLAVLKTTGPAGRGLLSFPLPGITLALDIPNVGEPLRPLARRLDEIVLRASGRLYLAKDALTDAPTFAAMYPRLGAFRAVRGRIDPSGRLGSSQSRRLGLSEGP
jgi:FAD/FMN-containing dehydrogenase